MKIKSSHLLQTLFLACCIVFPLSAAELVSIENVTLVDAGLNDGDSFKVNVRISQQSCHRLHGKAATHFTRKLPPITRQSCHP